MFIGKLLPARNTVGAGKTTVHKAASGLRGPQDGEEDGSTARSPLRAAEPKKGPSFKRLSLLHLGLQRVLGGAVAFHVQWSGGAKGSENSQSRNFSEAGAQPVVGDEG